jgi:hypothetical protein
MWMRTKKMQCRMSIQRTEKVKECARFNKSNPENVKDTDTNTVTTSHNL